MVSCLDEHATRRIAKQPRQQHRSQNTGDEVVAGDRAGPTRSRSTKQRTRVPTEGEAQWLIRQSISYTLEQQVDARHSRAAMAQPTRKTHLS